MGARGCLQDQTGLGLQAGPSRTSPWRCSQNGLPRRPGPGPPRPRRKRTRRTWRPPSWARLRLLTLDPASTHEAPPPAALPGRECPKGDEIRRVRILVLWLFGCRRARLCAFTSVQFCVRVFVASVSVHVCLHSFDVPESRFMFICLALLSTRWLVL